MATDQERLEKLDAAISGGARSVSYDGQTVTYRTLDEMQRIRDTLQARINGTSSTGSVRTVAASGKGL